MQYILSESDKIIENQCFVGALSARELHEDGRPRHTFRTFTVLAEGNRTVFKNCVFENNAGSGKLVGQAIALYVDADDVVLENCVLKGHQDTLFLAPLPPKEYEKDGFLGPKQFEPRTRRHVVLKDCRIEGGVDFVFGGAYAEFINCEFVSVEEGYVFAPCTPEGQEEGFVCTGCRFTAAEGVAAESCFIARPWREYAKVRLNNCYLGEHINPAGWDDWGKTEVHSTILFEEYGSYGPGAEHAARPEYVAFKKKDD